MSYITENTIVIKPDAEERVVNDLKEYGCSGINSVWRNDKMVIILFDNNGDNPWDIEGTINLQADWEDFYVIETNYGDDDGYWTQVFVDGQCVPYDGDALDWLCDNLDLSEYYTVKDLIAYNI